MTTSNQAPEIMKAALFVDFDNIYLGLNKMDPRAAEEFATNPARWIAWLEQGMPDSDLKGSVNTQHRALLLRRCYLNPGSFSNYRAYFTRSAFSVIDCPSLTSQNKNSADIHMVMDILDTLKHETHFDEFIILSGDADFTPVLLRLRTYDRRTVILTTGPAAQPYKAASDHVINGDTFIEDALANVIDYPTEKVPHNLSVAISANDDHVLDAMAGRVYEAIVSAGGEILALNLPPLFKEFPKFKNSNNWLGFYSLRDLTTELTRRKPEMCVLEGDPSWKIGLTGATFTVQNSTVELASDGETPNALTINESEMLKERIIEHVKQLVENSTDPVNMTSAAWDIIKNVGQEVINSHWAGMGSFKELLLSVDKLGFEIITTPDQPGLLYDPLRHTAPSLNSPAGRLKDLPSDLVAFASRINRVTGTPLLAPTEYALVFNILEEELKQNSYFLTTTSRAVRDRCIERGRSIPRKAVNFILQGIVYTGHIFEENPLTDTAPIFAQIFKDNILNLCRNAQLELSSEELNLLDNWILANLPISTFTNG